MKVGRFLFVDNKNLLLVVNSEKGNAIIIKAIFVLLHLFEKIIMDIDVTGQYY